MSPKGEQVKPKETANYLSNCTENKEILSVETFGGRVHVEWDPTSSVTPLGQLAFFIEFLKMGDLLDPWIEDCPLSFTSNNAPTKREVYGKQEGAVVGYNPKKPGRPSHTYHTYSLANLCLILDVEVQAGNLMAAKYTAPDLWALLDRIPRSHWPQFIRGDCAFGTDGVMSAAEKKGVLIYLN